MALDTQDPFVTEAELAAQSVAPSESVPASGPKVADLCGADGPTAEQLLEASRPKQRKLTVADLHVLFGQAVARIEALETEVRELKSQPAAPATGRSVPASGMQLNVPVLGTPLARGKCPAHGDLTLTKTGQCPTCLNAARRAAAGHPSQA